MRVALSVLLLIVGVYLIPDARTAFGVLLLIVSYGLWVGWPS